MRAGLIRAAIFDCDGVLADTEPMHWRALAEVLAPHSVQISWTMYQQELLGLTDVDMIRKSLLASGRDAGNKRVSEMVNAKAAIFSRALLNDFQPMPGIVDLVRRMAARFPIAICSGAFRAEVQTIVQQLDIDACIHTIVSCEDVAHSKPDPQGFLLALAGINALRTTSADSITPGETLVVEDSVPGVAAGKAAGMRVIQLAAQPAPASADSRKDGKIRADIVIERLDLITDELLDTLGC